MDGNSAVQFCEILFKQACEIAQTKPQMIDLLKAFRRLQLQEYSSQYGHIHGEWNEAMAITKVYTLAADTQLLPETTLGIAHAIRNWHQYSKISPEQQKAIEKAVQKYTRTVAVYLEQLHHFFNQLNVQTSSLAKDEHESIVGVVKDYQTQVFDAFHKGNMEEVNSLLRELTQQLATLCEQSEKPSRTLQQLTQKIQNTLPLWNANT